MCFSFFRVDANPGNKTLNIRRAIAAHAEQQTPELLARQLLEQIEHQYASELTELMIKKNMQSIQETATKHQTFISGRGSDPQANANLDPAATNILKLRNIVSQDEIENDPYYNEVYEDLMQELKKVGKISQLIIPRLKVGFEPESVGSVFVVYENQKLAQIARTLL